MKRYWVVVIVIVACAAAAVIGLRSLRPKGFNVLLVSLDTVRPDHLGCYGYRDIQTPNIDDVADEGIVFDDAMTGVPLTLPSHASILTGLYPISHGIRDNGSYVLRQEFVTLAEALKARGYATGAFVGAFVLDSQYGLDQGFDVYDDDMQGGRPTSAYGHPERSADAVSSAARAWIEHTKQPFFAFVHYYDPHTPYEPPAPFDREYAGRPYDGEIAYTDAALGKVLAAIAERGLMDRTLIVIVSDHGEGLGDHGEEAHGILVYQATVRVALVVRLPRHHDLAGAARVGRQVQPVELVDVAPTILELVGADPVPGTDGRSLVAAISGGNLPSKMCYVETMYPYLAYRWSPLRAVRFRNWKYILAPQAELYDLEADPGELTNLVTAYPDRVSDLKAGLLAIAGRERPADEASQAAASPEDMRKLQALGYVGTSPAPVPVDVVPRGADPKAMIADFQTYMGGGMEALEQGDYETALAKFRAYARLDPDNPKVHMYLARTLTETGDLDAAGTEFLRLVRADSTHIDDLSHTGNVYRLQGDLDRALFFYGLVARARPGRPGALSALGAILLEKGMTDSATAVLARALDADPDDTGALVNMGMAHLARGNLKEALVWFHKALRVDPGDVKALANTAYAFIKLGQPDSTLRYLELASNAAPDDASILQNLGSAYRQKGMTAEAGRAFERAVELEPDNVMSLFGLAAVRAETGDKDGAVTLLRRILEINPDFKPASRALQMMSSGT